MKKNVLIVLTFLLSLNVGAVDSVLLDFESGTVPATVSQWLNYSTGGTSSSVWSYPNPSPSDPLNSTSKCYKITKLPADPYWTGIEVSFVSPISITADNQYLHVFVYKTTASRIALTYTPENGSQSADLWQDNSTMGSWIDYVLPIQTGINLKTISVKIADTAGDYYFDQIKLSSDPASLSTTEISVDPADKSQVLKGWGGSICWWGNILGNYPDAKIKTVCDWITDPKDGLNMNIFRFNIGGGDDPSHNHMRTDGGAMPGYKASAIAPYDWQQDSAQRKVLKQLIASRIEKAGVNDIQLVGFSNSPPYWMTKSGCSAGNTVGNVTNLKSDMFDDFADYLTEVSRYYHDSLGINFNYLEPFNEPVSTWWTANGGQEGCYFSNSDQIVMIRELYNKLQEKDMLSYCRITANDANSIDEAYNSVLYYRSAGDILPKFPLIATHSYFGNNRKALASFAQTYSKDLWQSESGPLNVGGTNEFQMMTVSNRIITDMKDLKCTAWIDWQLVADQSPTWGLVVGDYKNALAPFSKAISFYIRAQYSRYIKAGYTLIGNNAANVLTALSPDEKELVIVISNKESYTQKYKVDLSKFSGFGKVSKIRTRAQESLGVKNSLTTFSLTEDSFTYDALSESVTTFVVPINQPPTALDKKKRGDEFSMYVNDGMCYLSCPKGGTCNLSFYNMLGQCVSSYREIDEQTALPIRLSKGLYVVKAEINGRTYATKTRIP